MVKEIDSHMLQARMSAGDNLHLVDIRSDTEVARGILPQASHLPMHLLPLRMREFPVDRDVVLYCHSGARSYHACSYLLRQGYRNVINLRGGIMDWARNGFAIAKDLAVRPVGNPQ